MPENKQSPQDGENINELLSQLKGIFGHLSDSEKEEAKQKTVPPSVPVPPRPAPTPPPEPAPPVVPSAPVFSEPPASPPMEFIPVMPDEPKEPPVSPITLEPWTPSEPALPMPPEVPAQPAPASEFTPSTVNVPEGSSLIPSAIFYPTGRIQEAKIVSEKVERITPKFTKVTFALNVQSMAPYEVKADLKTIIISQIAQNPIKAVFVLVDKPMEEARRKALIAELESRGIYFQEIAFHQVEKKAVYTDMLLGMVFFFDSQKPASPDANA